MFKMSLNDILGFIYASYIAPLIKQEGNVLQEPAAAMHQMFIWGCTIFSIQFVGINQYVPQSTPPPPRAK